MKGKFLPSNAFCPKIHDCHDSSILPKLDSPTNLLSIRKWGIFEHDFTILQFWHRPAAKQGQMIMKQLSLQHRQHSFGGAIWGALWMSKMAYQPLPSQTNPFNFSNISTVKSIEHLENVSSVSYILWERSHAARWSRDLPLLVIGHNSAYHKIMEKACWN